MNIQKRNDRIIKYTESLDDIDPKLPELQLGLTLMREKALRHEIVNAGIDYLLVVDFIFPNVPTYNGEWLL